MAGAGDDPRVVLLDIEGTTTPIAFAHEVLFPFARTRFGEFLAGHRGRDDVAAELARLAAEREDDRSRGLDPPEDDVAYLRWLTDQDRKSPPLKALQGLIWRDGYGSGELKAPVFDDVKPALERWRGDGRAVRIYSSGSVLAQELLFAHTASGDLTPLLDGYFDTAVGPKREAASYRRIAERCELAAAAFLFVSDVVAELDAAAAAGMATALSVRPGNPAAEPGPHPVVRSFAELLQRSEPADRR